MKTRTAFALTMSVLAVRALALEPGEKISVTLDPASELGPVKIMHAVNNGPKVATSSGGQKVGNFEDYRALRLPYARLHDSINCVPGGGHTVDISAVFPNFEADENNPKNYDFTFTDLYLKTILDAGTKIFYRLGQTIEHGPKKYGVMPPKDFAKWARICEHVVRHYNEGWGWEKPEAYSDRYKTEYWEIWNEPDLDMNRWQTDPHTWGGSQAEFCRLFGTTAKHLKTTFPDIKIGGPALAGILKWGEGVLAYCQTNAVPLDFFSWHIYANDPDKNASMARSVRKLMDKYGFGKAESILNEWNYIRGWRDDFAYSLRVICGDRNLKGAAYAAATMCACQDAPVDMLMYYDARTSTQFNGMFERVELAPIKGYYPFYAWGKLRDLGTQVGVTVTSSRKGRRGCWASAAKGADGRTAVFVVRYSEDDNVSDTAELTLSLKGGAPLAAATCHVTDDIRTYTEVPPVVNADGSVTVRLRPFAFALLEMPPAAAGAKRGSGGVR